MFKGFFVRVLFLSAAVLMLSGCFHDDDDDDDFSPPSGGDLVSGQFEDARLTNVWYPDDSKSNGYYGYPCVGEPHYFTTDDDLVRVYGSPGISETDFRVVATLVSDRFPGALSKFGLNQEQFIAERELFVPGAAETLASQINYFAPYEGQNDLTEGEKVNIWLGWSDQEKLALHQEVKNFESEYQQEPQDPWKIYHMIDKDTVVMCLNGEMGGNTIGEGTYLGILMAPNTNQYPRGAEEIITHELVHHIQDNLSRSGGDGYKLPRWFSEGQAIFLAGQSRASASEHYNYEPLRVRGFADEYGDIGEAYRHYGLAYWYLHNANGMEAIRELFSLMKTNTENPFSSRVTVIEQDGYEEYGVSVSFQDAFNATMVDHKGDPLTIERFEADYHNLMNQMY